MLKYKEYLKKLIETERYALSLLISLVIFTRLPWLLFVANNDPGADGALYINIGMNIAEGNGFTTDSKQWFYPKDVTDNTIGDQAFLFAPVYPMLLSLIFLIEYSAFSAKLLSTLLCAIFILVYYNFVKAYFNPKVAFISASFLVFDPIIYINSVSPLTDIAGSIAVLLTLYFVRKYSDKGDMKYVILAGIATGLSFLTRFPFGMLLPLIFGYFCYRKEWNAAKVFIVSGSILILYWFWVCYSNTGYFFPRLHSIEDGLYAYPGSPLGIPWEQNNDILSTVLFILRANYNGLVGDLFLSGVFVLLTPFLVIGFIKSLSNRNREYDLPVLFGCGIIIIHSLWYPMQHFPAFGIYFLPAFLVFLPTAITVLLDYTDYLDKSLKHQNTYPVFNGNFVLVTLFVCAIIISSGTLVNVAYSIRENEGDYSSDSYLWLDNNASKYEIVASPSPHRTYYYTELGGVNLANNLDNYYLEEFISFYNISYIYVEESRKHKFNLDFDWVAKIFNGTEEIPLFNNYRLVLVYTYNCDEGFGWCDQYSGKTWTYRVENI